MYYFLKDNVFYLRIENNGIFIKNNFCTVNIKNANSYKLFQMLLPMLNGKTDVEQSIKKLGNNKVKNLFKNFVDILVKNKFVLFSDFSIDLSKYNSFTKNLLCCYGSRIPDGNTNEFTNYEIYSADKKINKTIKNILSENNDVVKAYLNDEKYIILRHFNKNQDKILYIYKPKSQEIITVSSIRPNNENLDAVLYDLPMHIFEIISALIKIELKLYGYGIDVIDFSNEDYAFDLQLLTGKVKQRGNVNEN